MICINCNNEHESLFCPNCGEKSEVPKITFRSIFNDGLSTIISMDKGFLFNLKNLFLKPSEVVNGYIIGKRKYIYNPISYLVITISIYLIGDSLIELKIEGNEIKSKVYSAGYEAGKFIKSYLKYFWILSVIWLSLSTKLIFKKYNYAEHLAINSFIIGQATLVGFIGFLLLKLPLIFNPFIYLVIIWITYQIYKSKNNDFNIIFKSVGATFLFFIQLGLIVVLIGVMRS